MATRQPKTSEFLGSDTHVGYERPVEPQAEIASAPMISKNYPIVFTRGRKRITFKHGEDPQATYMLGVGWTREV